MLKNRIKFIALTLVSQNISEYCKKIDELILWEWYLDCRKDYGEYIDQER